MYDEMCDGEVIFKFNTCPCSLCPGVKEHELLVIRRFDDNDDLAYYALVRSTPIIDDFDEEDDIDNGSKEKALTIEQANHIIAIIENNKELMMVNSEISVKGPEGPWEEYYFSCPSFNRHTEGFAILFVGSITDEKETDKNYRDSAIVAKAFNEICDYLKELGVSLLDEEE